MENPRRDEAGSPRRPWVPPELIKHDSLTAVTRQYSDPRFRPDTVDANGDPIPCSQGFCP